jgi:hypothetical protein
MKHNEINFAAMPQTAINVITKPADFFKSMPKTGGFLEPLIFAVIMGLISGIIQAILSFVGLGPAGSYGAGMAAGFGAIIFMPIAVAIGSFIGAAILFVIWKLMGSQENYETAYRCGAYLMALAPITTILNAIPYAGAIISLVICTFYLVMASVYVHKIPAQKAWLVFGIIALIFALGGVWAEHKASSMGPWQQVGDEYRQSAEDLRKQAEEMARRYRR